MTYTLKKVVQECFDGERERDCSSCPAHYSKSGSESYTCCFGHRYEYDDEQCLSCPHGTACEPLTYQRQERAVERPRRSPATQRRLPIYGQSSSSSKENLLGGEETKISIKKPQSVEPEGITYLPARREGEGKWEHFFKGMGLMAAWGAGEGALELMLGYVKRRRPE